MQNTNVSCNSCCSSNKHFWQAKNFGSYSRNQGKYYFNDWVCDKCQVKIFGSSSACQKCGKRRPKKDDWYCQFHTNETSACNYLNHSSRTECRQCGAKKLCWMN